MFKNILSIAILYEKTPFYLPTFMDFRGRVYCLVNYLSFQGVDLAKSLIEFNDGCKLTEQGKNIALQYLANTAGKSKITLRNKEKWGRDFLNILKNIDLDFIIDNQDVLNIIKKSDEPAQFLSV